MTEEILSYIWQFQHFSKDVLRVDSGDLLKVYYAGRLNVNQGPDFLDARVQIGQTSWAGNVEIHVKSSSWFAHKHQLDPNFKNVVLHVAWENNTKDNPPDNIPLFCLKDHVSDTLFRTCEVWMKSHSFVMCGDYFSRKNKNIWSVWRKRLLMERMFRKSAIVAQFLKENKSWEETFWWMLARNFGNKVNIEAFEEIAKTLPLQLLAKYKNDLTKLEALLLGQAGLLEENFKEEYPQHLKTIYYELKSEHKLKETFIPVYFLRMRPANLPHIRLAQLAALIHYSKGLFAKIREADSLAEIKGLLWLRVSDYWTEHYTFTGPSTYQLKPLGDIMMENIVINTLAPLLYTYGQAAKDIRYIEKAFHWLEQIQPEQNVITTAFVRAGGINNNASDSQALIELKTMYCDKKQCENCVIRQAAMLKQ